jgi:hypothetical protein
MAVLTKCLAVWALYKEAMHYYDAVLNPAEDVTLFFPDNNFGNVHRLPIGNESQRAGGCGVSLPKLGPFNLYSTN